MAVESEEDRSVFVNPDEFGALGVYTPFGGAAVEIEGIYDDRHLQVQLGMEAGVTSSQPTFLCRSADLPGAAAQSAGDTLLVNGVTYNVVEIAPDGTGMTLLILSR